MNPEDLKYSVSHEWVGLIEENGEQVAVVGITDFAVEQLTDLVYMALPAVGTRVKAGQEFGEVESVKAVSALYSPVDGEVIASHEELVDNLETLGSDPFGQGWIIKVRLENVTSLDGLMDRAAYLQQCADA